RLPTRNGCSGIWATTRTAWPSPIPGWSPWRTAKSAFVGRITRFEHPNGRVDMNNGPMKAAGVRKAKASKPQATKAAPAKAAKRSASPSLDYPRAFICGREWGQRSGAACWLDLADSLVIVKTVVLRIQRDCRIHFQ